MEEEGVQQQQQQQLTYRRLQRCHIASDSCTRAAGLDGLSYHRTARARGAKPDILKYDRRGETILKYGVLNLVTGEVFLNLV
eukprot:SAG31_NODE_3113_length_4660_cov_2.867354_3_plen_82_part_00